jgi:DNA-binding helix-hairpin-helix protein with protein kinase domain
MTHPHLLVDGKPLPIGKRIGKGGEGEVYIVANDSNRAIKIYTAADGPAREAKIAAMIRVGFAQQTSLVAFPIAIARDQSGGFKGFVMHLVRDHKPVFELYGPGARKQQFPGADYRFLTRAASNTAKAIAAVHRAGCVIGDINHSGILVSKDATVALIDADSFQVIDGSDRYLCRVGVPEYTPPELQGVKLGNVVRTANHDAFGLAIAIFHLLCMGRHPFVGAYAKGEMPLPRAIEEYRFAYSRQRRVDMSPPPGVCTLEDFPAPIAAAFEAAFGPSGRNARPTASQWVALLAEFERSLQKCGKNPLHHYSSGVPACPWCRMEQKLHIVLFLPKDIGIIVPGPDTDDFNLPLLWAQIEAIRTPTRNDLIPTFPSLTPAPSAEAIAAKSQDISPNVIRAAGVAAAIALVIAAPFLIFVAPIVAWAAFLFADRKTNISASWRQRFLAIEEEWNEALNQRERRSGLEKIQTLKASLVEAKQAYEALASEEARRIKRYEVERQNLQRTKFLEGFRIRDQKISGIGPAKLAMLTSYGIETAADITPSSVLSVPGFGAVNSKPLLDWQQKCSRSFTHDPNPTAADQLEINKIKAAIQQRRQTLRQRLQSEARHLSQAVESCRSLKQADPALEALHARRAQVEADLAYLAVPLPPRPSRPTWTPPRPAPSPVTPAFYAQSVPPPTGVSPPSCPRCRTPMVRRTARHGLHAGKPFWGCRRFPRCRGTRPI